MTTTIFTKVWAVMILLLVVVTAMFVGTDLASNDWQGAIINGILLAFWVFAAVWFHFMALREQRMDFELEQSKKKLDDSMKDLLGEILGDNHKHHNHAVKVGNPENDVHEALSNTLVDIVSEVTKGDEPTTKHLPEIKKRFEAKTGHEAILTKEGHGLSVKISKEPVAKKSARKPATKKAPVKKPVATKKTVTKKKGE